MKAGWMLLLLLLATTVHADCVILLHGLARTSRSMHEMQEALEGAGYTVSNLDYPSREYAIAQLAPMAVQAGIEQCGAETNYHFVTHSLGGILLRYYLAQNELPGLGRVVMLAPPNQGSEVVDKFRKVPGFAAFNGPAGLQLGTDKESIPRQLPAVTYPVGIIAGDKTFNLILSQFLPNPDDGKVSLESTKVEGMTDFTVVPYSHPFIMQRAAVIQLVLNFLRSGSFAGNE